MSREVRRVPPPDVWMHPTETSRFGITEYIPLCDWCYCEFLARYEADLGTADEDMWDGPPSQDDPTYRPHFDPETRTWWQLYETVSEGTPLSPPFPTREALRAWLLAYGDYWEQNRAKRERRPVNLPSPAGVDALLDSGFAPTAMASAGALRDPYGDPIGSVSPHGAVDHDSALADIG